MYLRTADAHRGVAADRGYFSYVAILGASQIFFRYRRGGGEVAWLFPLLGCFRSIVMYVQIPEGGEVAWLYPLRGYFRNVVSYLRTAPMPTEALLPTVQWLSVAPAPMSERVPTVEPVTVARSCRVEGGRVSM